MTTLINQFPRQVREIENHWITLSDGIRLAARIWLPADAENDPVPAILEYLPYRKRDGTAERDQLTHPYFAGHGYACVRVDMRGCGDSDGILEDEYSQQELDDGVEVINWLAEQTWCTGKIGMMGISWGGFNGLQIAAMRPEPLEPDERYFCRIRLDDVARTLPRGHKLRLSLSTCYWPLMWPAPEPVTLEICTARSWLTVPVRSPVPGEIAPVFQEPVSAPPVELVELRAPSSSRQQTADSNTGQVTITIEDDFGLYQNAGHDLITGEVGRETHSIDPADPLSARMTTHWTQEIQRNDISLRTETWSTMRASASQFHLTARIEAWHNGNLVFERGFTEDIERDLN